MKTEKQFQINLKDIEITDSKEIMKYDKESKGKYYIPPLELVEGIDQDVVNLGTYSQSAKILGKALSNIYVSVNDNDPNKDSDVSFERIHLRIIDGRTRYLEPKLKGERWPVTYLRVRNYEEFLLLWTHFNSKKQNNVKDERNKVIQYCKVLENKGIEKSKIANQVIKLLTKHGQMKKTILYDLIPFEYKNPSRVEAGRESGRIREESSKKRQSKKDKIITEIRTELLATNNENIKLKNENKQLNQKIIEWNNLTPFLSSEHFITLSKSKKKIKVSIDVEKREIKVIED